jgi:hypothetical protein
LVEPLLATYSAVIAGMSLATWFFAFETRKTFRGGIFWGAWRIIATSLLFFMANQLADFYEAVWGSSSAGDAVAESFEALATIFLLVGFYRFYKAWNPSAMAAGANKP